MRLATNLSLSARFPAEEDKHTRETFRWTKVLLLVSCGGLAGTVYGFVIYGMLRPVILLGAGMGIFISLSYCFIEFRLWRADQPPAALHFIKGVVYYTPVIAVAIFVLMLMNDISLSIQEYGVIEDAPLSLSVLPLLILFSFFASFCFAGGRAVMKR